MLGLETDSALYYCSDPHFIFEQIIYRRFKSDSMISNRKTIIGMPWAFCTSDLKVSLRQKWLRMENMSEKSQENIAAKMLSVLCAQGSVLVVVRYTYIAGN